jgi:hypothetical protein
MAPANTLFALIAVARPEALQEKIAAHYPELSLEVGAGQWLIAAPSTKTTLELSKELGITGGDTGRLYRSQCF